MKVLGKVQIGLLMEQRQWAQIGDGIIAKCAVRLTYKRRLVRMVRLNTRADYCSSRESLRRIMPEVGSERYRRRERQIQGDYKLQIFRPASQAEGSCSGSWFGLVGLLSWLS